MPGTKVPGFHVPSCSPSPRAATESRLSPLWGFRALSGRTGDLRPRQKAVVPSALGVSIPWFSSALMMYQAESCRAFVTGKMVLFLVNDPNALRASGVPHRLLGLEFVLDAFVSSFSKLDREI